MQERTYFIDHIKAQNALMMKDISDLRTSILRHNARLVDWLAEHVGARQIQLIHKRPRSVDQSLPTIRGTNKI